jgi:hypothetical protein
LHRNAARSQSDARELYPFCSKTSTARRVFLVEESGAMQRCVVISAGSAGGGKSTLLDEFARR